MEIISLNSENLATEHICCAISDKKGEFCVSSKKTWLAERFSEGLMFKKLDVRGKVFIEYIPAEMAWCPIVAENYWFINCFWVSGQYKGKGYGNVLLQACIDHARAAGKKGFCVLSSKKKMPFLSDPDYLKHKGFQVCDTAQPYFTLLYLPFAEHEEKPRFKVCCKEGRNGQSGMVLYYTNQCPHTEKYAPLLVEIAEEMGYSLQLAKLDTRDAAQNAPTPFTTYSLFDEGKFVTNEILSEKKLRSYLEERGE